MRYRLLLSCFFVFASAAASSRVRRIVGGQPAEEPPPPPAGEEFTTPEPEDKDPLVFVKRDRRAAEVVGNRNQDGTASFLGIRYAEPPIKRLRFVRPKRVKLKGLVDATKFGPPCPQWFRGKLVGNEDCLFLNVYTPEVPSDSGKSPVLYPVLIWIHGGNFKSGSAAQYVPSHLVRKGIVVVTLQYRIGSLGFLSLGRKELPGNAGLFDMALAVRWVKDYIQFFGGNPERIISGGQGSGGSCASHLVLNNIVRRNLKGIIAMSGTPVSPFAMDEVEIRNSNEQAKVSGCTAQKGISFVRCMQALPLDTVLKGDASLETDKKAQSSTSSKLANLFTPGPAEEGKDDYRSLPNFVLESPLEAIQHGHFPKIPLLTGVTKQETGAGVKGNFFEEILKKLTTPTFLQKGLFEDLLKANTGLYVNNTVNPSLSKLFSQGQYLQLFTTLVESALSDIEKIIQHTTDAFFNLPAFIFSNFWSQKSTVFLYSFEHTPPKSYAPDFLNDISLVSNQSSDGNKEPSHGDDLIYLFDVRTLEGEPAQGSISEMSKADLKVRDHFTTAVVEFAKSGMPKTEGGDVWTPFNTKEGNYMIIKEIPKLAQGFRKCSMGLWTGDTNLLGSTECAFSGATEIVTNTLGATGTGLTKSIDTFNNTLGRVGDSVKSGVDKISAPFSKPLTVGISGLTSTGSENQKSKKPQSGGLLGSVSNPFSIGK